MSWKVIKVRGRKIEFDEVQKVKITAYIPEDLNRALRELIQKKYRRYEKGLLSWEITQALYHWVYLHAGGTHKNTQATDLSNIEIKINPVNPPPKVLAVYNAVKRYIFEKMGGPVQSIDYNILKEAIEHVRGTDRRTIRKWIDLFLRYKLIKRISYSVFELT